MNQWMIYGANGYTGELTARLAHSRGTQPILAGRREEPVRQLAEELDLPWRVFSLEESEGAQAGLEGVDAVIHCAGPFSATSKPMVNACLATGTHYLDITGEMAVFRSVFKRDQEAQEAGVVLMPGVGFDVVPTDCMAAMLHRELPDATHLEMAFAGLGSISRGTLKTAIEGLGYGGWVRRNGHLEGIPSGSLTRRVPFAHKTLHTMAIPWGDLVTAHRTTGIPNIVVYTGVPPKSAAWARRMDRVRWLTGNSVVQRCLKAVVDRREPGPDANLRDKGFSDIWGEVRNEAGDVVTGRFTTPEGYSLTALAALQCLDELGEVKPGAWTPAAALGPDLVTRIEGVTPPEFSRGPGSES